MDITTRVLAAIMLLGAGIRHLIAFLFVLLMGLGLVMRLDINPLYGYVIGFLFWKLVDEDFRTRLIDLRWIALLAVMSIFAVKNISSAAISAIVAMLVFDTLRFATCKFISTDEHGNDTDNQPSSKHERVNAQGRRYGYIPFLAMAFLAYIWYVGLFHPNIPWYLEPISISLTAIQAMAEENPAIATGIFMVVLTINIILRFRASSAQEKGMIIVPGFGAGDPPVLAIIAIFLGFQETMLVFFISLLVSLPAAIIQERRCRL